MDRPACLDYGGELSKIQFYLLIPVHHDTAPILCAHLCEIEAILKSQLTFQ